MLSPKTETEPADLAALPARERILSTAQALFYAEGIRATGIDRVIAESGVTKVTFYRHFQSKNELVLAYLQRRHERWMAGFEQALQQHGAARRGVLALVPALAQWFSQDDYRGCAFINAVGELGGALPEVARVAREHKQAMAAVIARLLPPGPHRAGAAQALALAVDGAIVQAQAWPTPAPALRALRRVVAAVCPAEAAAARR